MRWRRHELGRRSADGLRALDGALNRVRYEILPLPNALEQTAALPEDTVVTVTASPSKDIEATVEICEKLAAQRLSAVPHLAARRFRDRSHLRDVLDRLEGAEIEEIFVVGGDATETPGEFGDGLALLRAISELGRLPARVGVPSYPEGHPIIPEPALWQALRDKQSYATHTVTQMCFDADAVCRFVGHARQQGITLPVVAGVPGVVEMTKLVTIGMRIGVGDSIRFLNSNRSVLDGLIRKRGNQPETLLAQLGTRQRDQGCVLSGLHFYTFNRVEATARWVEQAHRLVV